MLSQHVRRFRKNLVQSKMCFSMVTFHSFAFPFDCIIDIFASTIRKTYLSLARFVCSSGNSSVFALSSVLYVLIQLCGNSSFLERSFALGRRWCGDKPHVEGHNAFFACFFLLDAAWVCSGRSALQSAKSKWKWRLELVAITFQNKCKCTANELTKTCRNNKGRTKTRKMVLLKNGDVFWCKVITPNF